MIFQVFNINMKTKSLFGLTYLVPFNVKIILKYFDKKIFICTDKIYVIETIYAMCYAVQFTITCGLLQP